MHFLSLAVVTFTLVALQEPAAKSLEFDYSKLDRKIANQPKFVAEPKYALLLLGDGKARIWMALDKSVAGAAKYDVLYVDRDGDGNLGEEGERIIATREGQDDQGLYMDVGKVELGDPKIVLGEFRVAFYTYDAAEMTSISFSMNGKVTMYGPYGALTHFKFGGSPDKAPILHADPWGPLAFHHVNREVMPIGKSTTFMLYVGTSGSGKDTFMGVDEHFLDLDKDKIFATVIAKDAKGAEVRQRTQLKEHC